jgi:transaldolase
MKFFLDTANLDEIRDAASTGVLDGITTNPSLIAREGKSFQDLILQICSIVDGPVSAEVTSVDVDGMVAEGRSLAGIHPNVVVKCPFTLDGLKATKSLSDDGIDVNVTLVFSAPQALMAAKAGARFVSPFLGRLDDIGQDGMALVEDIVTIYDNYEFATEVLAASIRGPLHVVQAARAGADVCTIPHKVFIQLMKHPLTDIGLAAFLRDWEKMADKVPGSR